MENEYWTNLLNKLCGSVIEQAISDKDGEFFGLQIRTPLGIRKIIWFLRDEEGNGPGAFDIQTLKGKQNG